MMNLRYASRSVRKVKVALKSKQKKNMIRLGQDLKLFIGLLKVGIDAKDKCRVIGDYLKKYQVTYLSLNAKSEN